MAGLAQPTATAHRALCGYGVHNWTPFGQQKLRSQEQDEGADPCAPPERGARLAAVRPRGPLHREGTKSPKSPAFPETRHTWDSSRPGTLPRPWGGESVHGYLRLSSRVSSSEEKVPLLTLRGQRLLSPADASWGDEGSFFFLRPNHLFKGWNLPPFFLSADDKTNTRCRLPANYRGAASGHGSWGKGRPAEGRSDQARCQQRQGQPLAGHGQAQTRQPPRGSQWPHSSPRTCRARVASALAKQMTSALLHRSGEKNVSRSLERCPLTLWPERMTPSSVHLSRRLLQYHRAGYSSQTARSLGTGAAPSSSYLYGTRHDACTQ
ncbi:uncharacterized protein LOC123392045 [Mustela putorius furo]|uniref:Uncharacterized protein LOC123392045 n=1 Tax=Mustela putorius furo TaxID=9669 RepID=A0A8U0S3K8_MUSPF|nr:uncharacterized protein LOC123392045 [Mustela putorius furo]